MKNGRWMSRCGDMRSARGRGCGGVQGNESSWQMSGRGDMRSARGRGGDLEHFFAGSIAVGAEGVRTQGERGTFSRGVSQWERGRNRDEARVWAQGGAGGGKSGGLGRGKRARF